MRLEGKNIVVTGASAGMGRAIVTRFVQEGANVVAVARRKQLLEELAGEKEVKSVVVDPSAASFIETIRRHGRFTVRKANNDVIDGIRITGSLLQKDKLFFCDTCNDSIREFGLYRWDEKAQKDCVVKEFDHAMDDIRYACNTIFKKRLM